MNEAFKLIKPRFLPPLDEGFRPAVLVNRAFQEEVERSGKGIPLVFGLERTGGYLSRFETFVLPEGHPNEEANLQYAERILKFLLWQRGGWKVYVGGPYKIGKHLSDCYSPGGERKFDYYFMGEDVYDETFTVIPCTPEEVPEEQIGSKPLGRQLKGNRIGFDLGASDRKVSAVIDGEAVFSEEVIWEPKSQADPDYHYHEISKALKTAAAHLPRVDAIGGSAAGIYIDNRVRIASLFRGVPTERYDEIRNLFLRIQKEWQVPLEIVNDGDVTALAGAMSLEDGGVLGIAMGSSEAGGYINLEGNITGWLNELAFAPVDYSLTAPVDEWSGDRGVGGLYFSQQSVFRLAKRAGIHLPKDVTDADKLVFVQQKLEAGEQGAIDIWRSIGCYLGYALAHYCDFYLLKHVLILGRCTSGSGGALIVDGARQVLRSEFPEIYQQINVQLPDEKSRRVGQSIAAASLPEIQAEV